MRMAMIKSHNGNSCAGYINQYINELMTIPFYWCLYIYICIYIYVCNRYIYINIYIYIYINIYIYILIYIYIIIYIYYIYILHIYIYTHAIQLFTMALQMWPIFKRGTWLSVGGLLDPPVPGDTETPRHSLCAAPSLVQDLTSSSHYKVLPQL